MVHAFVSVLKYKWIFSFRMGSLSKNDLCPLSSLGTPEGQKTGSISFIQRFPDRGRQRLRQDRFFLPIHSQPSPWKEKKKKMEKVQNLKKSLPRMRLTGKEQISRKVRKKINLSGKIWRETESPRSQC